MSPALRARPAEGGNEDGFTLIELLVGMIMGVVLMGAVSALVIGVMRSQPEISTRAQNISSARTDLERLTREIRNGVVVDEATPSAVSFRAFVRHSTCGSTTLLPSEKPAIPCQVRYSCTATECTRSETAPGVLSGGTPTTIFSGISESKVFCYVPSTNSDPTTCGPAPKEVGTITYIGIKLKIPNPSGPSALTISDGASLTNAILKD
jgi:prepilin-type N-terminal cleavage/methylation domain-containing protein